MAGMILDFDQLQRLIDKDLVTHEGGVNLVHGQKVEIVRLISGTKATL